jgi:histidinol-phosphate phosphatase family protein
MSTVRSTGRAAVFLDKDGTLLVDVPYNVDPAQMCFMPGAAAGLRRLAGHGLPLIVISNQPGVALGRFAPEALGGVGRRLSRMFSVAGAHLAGFYHCPHHPDGEVKRYALACTCRKPMPGLLQRAARDHGLDLSHSWFVGDILDDIEAGSRAGCRTILLDNGHETEWASTPATALLRAPGHRCADLQEAAELIVGCLHPSGMQASRERA